MTDIIVRPDGTASIGPHTFRCALGRSGITDAKREGDGATPIGRFALRRMLYRPDGLPKPETELPADVITAEDGWCDDPGHARYKRPVQLPFEGSCEKMFRDDHVYDVVVILGHNDDPPVPYAGSAIFLHLARPDYSPTEGCVALELRNMLTVLELAQPGDSLCVTTD